MSVRRHLRHSAALAVSLLLFGTACGAASTPDGSGGDGEHQRGFTTLCHAEAQSGAVSTFPFAEKMRVINEHLDAKLKDEHVRTLHREKLPQEPLAYQGDMLRRRASANGVKPCPMAGLIDFLGGLSTTAHGADDCQTACIKRHEGTDVPNLETSCTEGCGG